MQNPSRLLCKKVILKGKTGFYCYYVKILSKYLHLFFSLDQTLLLYQLDLIS